MGAPAPTRQGRKGMSIMSRVIKYVIVVAVILAVAPLVFKFLTKERIYYTEVERIVQLHSNKWGDKTMDFYFQYPHHVEEHFLANPGKRLCLKRPSRSRTAVPL